jgi:hypothetical protein
MPKKQILTMGSYWSFMQVLMQVILYVIAFLLVRPVLYCIPTVLYDGRNPLYSV